MDRLGLFATQGNFTNRWNYPKSSWLAYLTSISDFFPHFWYWYILGNQIYELNNYCFVFCNNRNGHAHRDNKSLRVDWCGQFWSHIHHTCRLYFFRCRSVAMIMSVENSRSIYKGSYKLQGLGSSYLNYFDSLFIKGRKTKLFSLIKPSICQVIPTR